MPDPITRLNAALEGRYRIERELGQGGMATVYLADDLKHERKVALKVLKPELAAVVGAERFLAEIKTTANLQHPHILPLFDSGEADTFLFYVMPYVEGETLRDRLDREHQLPVDDAVQIAKNVAEALDYAHKQGVIHRDIKPANILLQAGKPVISDFGIALAVGVAGGGRLTETGLSLGTPHYMSPEQATGDLSVGAATDVYALGCVLYEMLVGEPPYTGSTAQAILGKIIAGKLASATEHRRSVPANVDAAIRKSLEKLPADRFTSARDFSKALGDVGFWHGEAPTPGSVPGVGRWNRLSATLAAFLVAAIALAAWGWLRPGAAPDRQVIRYAIDVPMEINTTTYGTNVSLSPDGSRLVYSGEAPGGSRSYQLWLRERNSLESFPIPGTEGGRAAFFSPDGEQLAFTTAGGSSPGLKITSLRGDTPRLLVGESEDPHLLGGDWGHDGYIYFIGGSHELKRIPETGGSVETITQLNREAGELQFTSAPQLLPGGRGVLFSVQLNSLFDPTQTEIAVADLETRTHKRLLRGVAARATPTGDILVVRGDGSLDLVPFDQERLEVTGSGTALFRGIGIERWATADLFLSESGTLLYGTRGLRSEIALQEFVWVDRNGSVTQVDPGWTGSFTEFALSPDGTQLATGRVEEVTHDEQIWVKELDRGPPTKVTSQTARNRAPTWTLGGQSLSYCACSGQDLLYTTRADGSAEPQPFLSPPGFVDRMTYSADGLWLLYEASGDIYALNAQADSVSRVLLGTTFRERSPAISPDGRWLAYVTDASGRDEVNVRSFPEVEGFREQVSSDGASAPIWAGDGSELFFVSGGMLVAAEVLPGDQFLIGDVESLFPLDLGPESLSFINEQRYAVAPDRQRFLVTRPVGEPDTGPEVVVVIENFLEELRERVPN